ncbi:MAG: alpha/beta hydrolase [Acidimicrobiales bacterium]
MIEVAGTILHTGVWGAGAPQLVLLHDGLGSIAQWREFPADLAAATGLTVLAYDRAGHGRSTPTPSGGWPADWLAREADVLGELLRVVGIDDPVLVGHSDGGSIAAIHASRSSRTAPLVLLAAHSWMEPIIAESIEASLPNRDDLVARLARFHDQPDALFDAWSLVWTSSAFADWDMRPSLSSIVCPTLVVQGVDDEYASPEHASSTAAAIGENAAVAFLPDAGHLLHRSQPKRLVEVVADFINAQRSSDPTSETPEI